MDGLLDDAALERSSVVANCAMNRERRLTGVNSYARELGFDPLDRIGPGGWLDLCCGTGRALIEAAALLRHRPQPSPVVGVDLVDAFDAAPPPPAGPRLICASVVTWLPAQAGRRFDLVTCLHGLHYVGDKLGVLAGAAGLLTPGGHLVADLDLVSIKGCTPARTAAALRAAGFTVDTRRRRVSRTGPWQGVLPFTYLGGDDRAGPNYTGQPAVDSHYAVAGTGVR